MTSRNQRAGVTLLETLIGLLVMSMVAALLSAAFGTNLRLVNRSQLSSTFVEHAMARRDFRIWLEHSLENPVPDEITPVLFGNATELRFMTVPPGNQFWPGSATTVTLGPEAIATGTGVTSDRTAEVKFVLAIAPAGTMMELQYWGRATADQAPAWQETWSPDQGLPDLIRVAFVGKGPLPPPMAIRPAKAWRQSEMSVSSLVPPALPSRP